jgi:hypothetical protein
MPKLSQQTLEKRFHCPYCSVTLRTRQGLSGHIQFRHPRGTTGTGNINLRDAIAKITVSRRLASESTALSDAEFQEMAEIWADWRFIKVFMGDENIKFNNADYKTYLLVAAALMYGNQRLMKKLNKDLSSAITQLREISSKMATKS